MNAEETLQQIRSVIIRAIAVGIANDQKYPAIRVSGASMKEIYIQGAPDLSISMRNRSYGYIYEQLERSGAYHIKMIDGTLLQMLYRFQRRRIISHRLSLFPAPVLESYDRVPEIYEEDEAFGDMAVRSTVPVPIRFDFSADPRIHIDIEHLQSHLTLGDCKGCRIPVTGPLTPFQFMRFVLRHFYSARYTEINLDRDGVHPRFPETITSGERDIAYLVP